MKSGRLSRFLEIIQAPRSIAPLAKISGHIRSLSPGDKLIAGILGVLVLVTSIAAVFVFTRSLLVEVPAHGGSLTEGAVGSPRFVNPLLALTDADRDLTAITFSGLMVI